MKKIGIITHYDVHNHGAVLQLYALSRVLNELGYEAKALTFNKNFDFIMDRDPNKKYNISLRSIPYYFGYLFKKGIRRTLFNIKKRKLLLNFKEQEKLVGQFYATATDLDAVVIGSDEIFSVEVGLNPWFFGIGVPNKKQISYAASFGPTNIELIEKHNASGLVYGGLRNIRCISVRDENSQHIVEHYTEKKPVIVCDPVLLYSGLKDLIGKTNGNKVCKNKYVVVYSYDNNMNSKEEVSCIREYAKKIGAKIVSVGYYHKWCDKNVVAKPLELFELFSKAEMVFTDTFHGSVISLVSNTQFQCKIRGNGNKLRFLLEQYNLGNRIVDSFATQDIDLIDYKKINGLIDSYREKSLEFLKESLLEIKND